MNYNWNKFHINILIVILLSYYKYYAETEDLHITDVLAHIQNRYKTLIFWYYSFLLLKNNFY